MEGLEVSEVLLSDIINEHINLRIDSEYFKKQYLNFFRNVQNIQSLGDLVSKGYRVVYENTKTLGKEEAVKNDYPFFLQAADLNTPFLNKENIFYVHQDEWVRYQKGRIEAGEILIEVKGKIEKVAIVPNDFPEKTLVSGSLFKLTVKENFSKYVLLCYLISKYGTSFKERYKTNSLISFVNKPDLYRIPVPRFSKNFQRKVDKLFEILVENKEQSQTTYKVAEALLLTELGLDNLTPSNQPVNIKSLADSFGTSGRLDAEYYQPKYEEVLGRIKAQPHDCLDNLVTIKKSIEPGSNYYSDEGLPFMRVADFSKNGLTTPQKCLSAEFVKENKAKLAKLYPTKDTILFSKDGSVGTAFHLTENKNLITSGAILHLNIKDRTQLLPEYLTLVLNSELVQMQAERDAGGSIILHWRVSEIEAVLVPILKMETQQTITQQIQQSFTLKTQSEQLLDIAKHAVEMAIEQDEDIATSWIEAQLQGMGIDLKEAT